MFVVRRLCFSVKTLERILDIFIYVMQVYILVLWTVPRVFWNLIGGIFFAIQSAVVMLVPDLPGYFDDFGVIMAIFAYIFIVINTVADPIKKGIDKYIIDRFGPAIRSYVLKNKWVVKVSNNYTSYIDKWDLH